MNKPSPMMQHYLEMKEQYKDCILFYRLGDFYEMFFEDAIKVSEMLDITLTGKDCGLEERAPMCGIPFHAADTYILKLVKLGQRVAICEQVDKTMQGTKEIVRRDVVRIVSSGTLTDDTQIDEKSNNYIACVYYSQKGSSISWADITTGAFYTQEFNNETALISICDSLVRISPAEIICNSEIYNISNDFPIIKQKIVPNFTSYNDRCFNYATAERSICNHFNTRGLNGLGINDKPYCVSSSGALLEYLNETQKHALANISLISVYNNTDYMLLNGTTLNNLDVVKNSRSNDRYGTLLWVLDKTKTSMGSRKLKEWILSPLTNIDKINLRLDAVEELYQVNMTREGLAEALKSVKDIERLVGKISNDNITPRDCVVLKNSLEVLPTIKFLMTTTQSKLLSGIESKIDGFENLTSILDKAISKEPPLLYKNGDFIADGFDEELDRLRSVKNNAKQILFDLEQSEKEKTGIKTLKIGFNKVFGYYIEVSNSFKNAVPYNYVRKQTLTTGERFITEELKNLEDDILGSAEKSLAIENEIYNKIKSLLRDNIEQLQETANAVAALDVLVNFAYIAKTNKYTRPEILPYGERLNLVASRHPVVESISKNAFISNDVLLDNDENRTLIITGPNMAGKSTYMRQIALINIMAQIGCFVPCKSASIPLVDKIFTRVGASDNLVSDQSTFMVEMSEVSEIIMNATPNSMLILDEVGRGTSTYDGLSIAWAVVEYLNEKVRAKTLFSTHYHELSELENVLDGVKNYKLNIKEFNGQLLFLRKVTKGSANKSFGIEVASLAGVPKTITDRAKNILKKLEKKDLLVTSPEIDDFSQIQEDTNNKNDKLYEIVSEVDLNNLTPIQAFKILSDLKGITDAED